MLLNFNLIIESIVFDTTRVSSGNLLAPMKVYSSGNFIPSKNDIESLSSVTTQLTTDKDNEKYLKSISYKK